MSWVLGPSYHDQLTAHCFSSIDSFPILANLEHLSGVLYSGYLQGEINQSDWYYTREILILLLIYITFSFLFFPFPDCW